MKAVTDHATRSLIRVAKRVGLADRMLATLGHEPTARGVAELYRGLLDTFVIDEADAALAPRIAELGMRPVVLPTIMRSDADRAHLAESIVALA